MMKTEVWYRVISRVYTRCPLADVTEPGGRTGDQGKSRWVEVAAAVFLETVYTWLLATVPCSWLPSRQYYTTYLYTSRL